MSLKLIKGPRFSEIAVCSQGMNALSDVKFRKSSDAITLGRRVKLSKEHDDAPRMFDDVIADENAWDVSNAIDNRSWAFNRSAWEILSSEATDPAALIIESLHQFAGTLEDDIQDLLDGRIQKALTDGDVVRKLAQVSEIAKAVVEGKLTEGGDTVANKFKKADLSEEAQAEFTRLEKAVEANQAAADGHVLFLKACEYAAAEAEFLAADPDNSDPILKSISDPVARAVIKKDREDIAALTATVDAGRKLQKMTRLKVEAEGYAPYSTSSVGEIVTALAKAEDAGPECAEVVRGSLKKSADEMRAAGALTELGSGGSYGSDDPVDAAEMQIAKAATEIRKANPGMTEESAYVAAMNQSPELYDAADTSQYDTAPS